MLKRRNSHIPSVNQRTSFSSGDIAKWYVAVPGKDLARNDKFKIFKLKFSQQTEQKSWSSFWHSHLIWQSTAVLSAFKTVSIFPSCTVYLTRNISALLGLPAFTVAIINSWSKKKKIQQFSFLKNKNFVLLFKSVRRNECMHFFNRAIVVASRVFFRFWKLLKLRWPKFLFFRWTLG